MSEEVIAKPAAALFREHPAQLCWGFLLLVEEQAREKRQPVFTFLAEVARPAVLAVRDVITDTARRAEDGERLVDRLVADGAITPANALELRDLFTELATEAREGRVIR